MKIPEQFFSFCAACFRGFLLRCEEAKMYVLATAVNLRSPFARSGNETYAFNAARIVTPHSRVGEILRPGAFAKINAPVIKAVVINMVNVALSAHDYAVHQIMVTPSVKMGQLSEKGPCVIAYLMDMARANFGVHTPSQRNDKIILNGNGLPLFASAGSRSRHSTFMAAILSTFYVSLKFFTTSEAFFGVYLHADKTAAAYNFVSLKST